MVNDSIEPAFTIKRLYNGRGTAEQWIREGKNTIRWTRLSCRAFKHNAVRLQLHALEGERIETVAHAGRCPGRAPGTCSFTHDVMGGYRRAKPAVRRVIVARSQIKARQTGRRNKWLEWQSD